VTYVFDNLSRIKGTLKRFPFGLVTDVDGTISPTADTPQQAVVSPSCRYYLDLLCRHLTLVAAISGRAALTIKDMLGVPGMIYVGNHGLERLAGGTSQVRADLKDFPAVIESVLEALAPLLETKGISFENKGFSASVHYRLTADPGAARREILSQIKQLPQADQLKILENRRVIDLMPGVEVDKGTALRDLIREYRLQGVIYLGDDLTDIHAFRALHQAAREPDFQGYAIGVVSAEMPPTLTQEADFTLNGVADVARFLEWLYQTIS
jgi:trehalose 6-phosphate phosphatase